MSSLLPSGEKQPKRRTNNPQNQVSCFDNAAGFGGEGMSNGRFRVFFFLNLFKFILSIFRQTKEKAAAGLVSWTSKV